jgi:hypothetical protein
MHQQRCPLPRGLHPLFRQFSPWSEGSERLLPRASRRVPSERIMGEGDFLRAVHAPDQAGRKAAGFGVFERISTVVAKAGHPAIARIRAAL